MPIFDDDDDDDDVFHKCPKIFRHKFKHKSINIYIDFKTKT